MQLIKKNLVIIIAILILILFETITYEGCRFLSGEPTVLSSKIDDSIPFIPSFIYAYILWYLAIFFVPLIIYLKQPINFYKYAASLIITIIIGVVIFLVFPTTVARPNIEVTDITSWIVNAVFFMDTPALCCLPSMHCALCFLLMIYSLMTKKLSKWYKAIISIICIVIVLSTLFIKQHVAYDVIAALVIVAISCYLVFKYNIHTFIQKFMSKFISASNK